MNSIGLPYKQFNRQTGKWETKYRAVSMEKEKVHSVKVNRGKTRKNKDK